MQKINQQNKKTTIMMLCALFTALTAIGAFIRIPTPLVPITLQDLFTMLAGLLLGPKYGAISVCCYLLLGLLGVPVFTFGGGIGSFLRPTFGYLIAFAIGAWINGSMVWKKEKPTTGWMLFANLVSLVVIYAIGTAYVFLISKYVLGVTQAFWPLMMSCVILPLPGDLVKSVLAAGLASRLLPIIRERYIPRG